MSRPPSLRLLLGSCLLALAVAQGARPAQASPDDHDDDEGAAEAPVQVASRAKRRAKPTPFDRHWLEPFFERGTAKQAVEQFRAEDWQRAATALTKALRTLPRQGETKDAAQYLLALARANLGDWAEAGKLFEDLYTRYPKLAPYHAYNAARCRLRRGDPTGAIEWAARVAKGTVPEAEAELVRVDALRQLSRWNEVSSSLEAYLARFPNGPRRAEAMFKRAEALERAPAASDGGVTDAAVPATSADTVAIYRRVWAEAPTEPWSERAAQRLEEIAAALPGGEAAAIRKRTAGEWVTRGTALFDHNRNAESEAAFGAALGAPGLDAGLECKARFYRAQSVFKARQRPRAAPLFDEAEGACARAGDRDLHAKSLYQGARCYANKGDIEAARTRYARVEIEHPDHSYADDSRVRAAELASDAGDEATAAKLLAEVPTRYPHGDLLNEALWRLAFAAWRADRLDESLHWLDENLRLIPREEIWYAEGRALYWKGRIYEKQGDRGSARTWYTRAVREYPLSVYALLALGRMKAIDGRATEKLVTELRRGLRNVPAWTFPPRALYAEPGFERAVALARMGQGGDARRELSKLGLLTSVDKHATGAARSEDEDLIWITAILLDRGGVWSASHSLPRYGVTTYRQRYPEGVGAAKWKLAYPRAYPGLVAKNARANDLPEALQLAIMREESAFSPRIESFANAVGLTQMLVKTAKRFSDGKPVTREVLMDPERNLQLGSRFLGFLWKHFEAAAPLAIAGYNAGEGAVDRWLSDRGDLAMDEFMETIPYDETRNYTKRVLSSYFTYSWLYGPKPVPTIPLAARPKAKGAGRAATHTTHARRSLERR